MAKAVMTGLLAVAVLSSASAQERDEAWVRQRVKQIKESDTTGFLKVPWAPSLLEARKAAKDGRRPVFLFTLDGNLETGRC
jgi:hypothetical protein